MTYEELLLSEDWINKCQEIVSRDMYKCQDCRKTGAHTGTFLVLKNINDVDELLGTKLFDNKTFSAFIDNLNITDKYFYQFNKLPLKCKKELDNRYVNSVWLYEDEASEKKPIFGCVLNDQSYDFVVDRTIESYPAKACYKQLDQGSYVRIVFEDKISDDVTIIVENRYNRANINVVTDNIVHCCRFNHNFDWKNTTFYPQIPSLNVHHKYYIEGVKPWDYEDSALVTLCQDCHYKRHNETIPVYKSIIQKIPNYYIEKCQRCGGSGFIEQYDYYCNGICFACYGEGAKVNW